MLTNQHSADLLVFPCRAILGFAENSPKRESTQWLPALWVKYPAQVRNNGRNVSSWYEGDVNSNNYSLQPRYEEEHLWMHSMQNLKAHGIATKTSVLLLRAKNLLLPAGLCTMLQNSHHLNLAISIMNIQPTNLQQLHYSTMSMWTNVSITLLNLFHEKVEQAKGDPAWY